MSSKRYRQAAKLVEPAKSYELDKAVALSEDEVNEILKQTEARKDKPAPRVMFSKGEGVRVIEGPFTNFSGAIEEVNTQRGKLRVMVSIFGRQTPVELEFWQVERL